ncbi:AraC family transcriptional regulator [Flavobacterium sp. MFBS3-15]|uniref:AraC family transcriptional regulator n=1 Tax=Flavobacterium sp. MFBS3-15 TaxID=2989816 RepID=UPI002236526C|nr:helix-turn-helix transcriptional regulator [Flavobacterium sp. MFBS3-15]MCW4467805.1 AraC family transcriptional regulator [Flavobacterium sp. MFBS3-15]
MKQPKVLRIEEFDDNHASEEFYANTLENHLETRHKDIAHPHSHDFYLAILFTKGSGTHEIDFKEYEAKPGALFFLNPGQTHHWELSEDTEGYIFFHSQAFYDLHYTHNLLGRFPFYFSMHQLPVIYTERAQLDILTQLFQNILSEYNSGFLLKKEALLSLSGLVYITATRLYPEYEDETFITQNNYYGKFRGFEALVEQFYRDTKSPSSYASMMYITPRHLNRIAQSVVGKSALDVIQDRILLEAKKMLVMHKTSFSEIAITLGFADYAYFSRLFKKKVGQTPSEFLERYGKR